VGIIIKREAIEPAATVAAALLCHSILDLLTARPGSLSYITGFAFLIREEGQWQMAAF
jgi:hypothetical protein